MIPALTIAALLAQAAPDPCASVPRVEPDPEVAAEYQAVGDEERAAGRQESAVAAYRAALARDPDNGRARASLGELCSTRRTEQQLASGLALFRAGHCDAALEPLAAARARGDAEAALLEGICLYRAGRDEQATTAFGEAEKTPSTRSSARLFLGLLALRRGRPAEASPLLESAAQDPLLAPVAQGLARDLKRKGRFVVSLLAEGGWDSNADLSPGDELAPAGDGFAGGAVVGSASPWGESGPFVRAAATWRGQFQYDDLDLLGVGAAAGWQLGPWRRHVLLEVGFDHRRVGGDAYLSAPRLLAEGRVDLGGTWSASGWYTLRREEYPNSKDFSGPRHAAQVDLTAALGERLLLSGAWQGGIAAAEASALSHREHGPVLAAAMSLGARSRMVLGAGWTWREYDAVDPDLERRRSDQYLDLAGRAELDLWSRWTLQLSVAGRRAYSNLADFRYARVVSTLGLSWTMGL